MFNVEPGTTTKPITCLEDAIEKCQELGMRLSRQRRSILELLWQAEEHLSARQIYDRLNQEGKDIGHTSVYQNLEALSQQGIIECVERSMVDCMAILAILIVTSIAWTPIKLLIFR